MSTHALRHSAATDVYRASRDVMAIRDMLGHQSLATTQGYVKGLDTEALREAMEGRTGDREWLPNTRLEQRDHAGPVSSSSRRR